MSTEFRGEAVAVEEVERASGWCESGLCCYNRVSRVTTSCRERFKGFKGFKSKTRT